MTISERDGERLVRFSDDWIVVRCLLGREAVRRHDRAS